MPCKYEKIVVLYVDPADSNMQDFLVTFPIIGKAQLRIL